MYHSMRRIYSSVCTQTQWLWSSKASLDLIFFLLKMTAIIGGTGGVVDDTFPAGPEADGGI